MSKLPCGHPRAAIRIGEETAPGQYVHTCAWCESLDVARWQAQRDERQRCHAIALAIAASLRNSDVATEASLAAERVAREILKEEEKT